MHIIIPLSFYVIYWVYKSAQRIDKIANAKGVQSDISTLCLILSIFAFIVAPIIMQDKINAIITAKPAADSNSDSNVHQSSNASPIGLADELKLYKELFDDGVISQEEFDAKKKQLLGL